MYDDISEWPNPEMNAATSAVVRMRGRRDKRGMCLEMPSPSQYDPSGSPRFAGDPGGGVNGVKPSLGDFEGHPREIRIGMLGVLQHEDVRMLVMFLQSRAEVAHGRDVVGNEPQRPICFGLLARMPQLGPFPGKTEGGVE
jgi:hypothetical protein